jgi:hypothetical protein
MQGLAKEKRLSIERTEVLQVGTPEKEFEAEEKVRSKALCWKEPWQSGEAA